MDGPIRQLTESATRPEQELAAAVFQRALDDAGNASLPAQQRAARIFLLADTGIFDFWAAVLGAQPSTVRQYARLRLQNGAASALMSTAHPAAKVAS